MKCAQSATLVLQLSESRSALTKSQLGTCDLKYDKKYQTCSLKGSIVLFLLFNSVSTFFHIMRINNKPCGCRNFQVVVQARCLVLRSAWLGDEKWNTEDRKCRLTFTVYYPLKIVLYLYGIEQVHDGFGLIFEMYIRVQYIYGNISPNLLI